MSINFQRRNPVSRAAIRVWTQALKLDVMTLYFAMRHARTSWAARACATLVTTYAFSPIDLIPDFIPVLGYVDDLLIVPINVWLLLKLLPRGPLVFSVISDGTRSQQRRGVGFVSC